MPRWSRKTVLIDFDDDIVATAKGEELTWALIVKGMVPGWELGHLRLLGLSAHLGGPGRRLLRCAEHRPRCGCDRSFLLAADVVCGPRQRLGPGRRQQQRRRLGQHGPLRLGRPCEPERQVEP